MPRGGRWGAFIPSALGSWSNVLEVRQRVVRCMLRSISKGLTCIASIWTSEPAKVGSPVSARARTHKVHRDRSALSIVPRRSRTQRARCGGDTAVVRTRRKSLGCETSRRRGGNVPRSQNEKNVRAMLTGTRPLAPLRPAAMVAAYESFEASVRNSYLS